MKLRLDSFYKVKAGKRVSTGWTLSYTCKLADQKPLCDLHSLAANLINPEHNTLPGTGLHNSAPDFVTSKEH